MGVGWAGNKSGSEDLIGTKEENVTYLMSFWTAGEEEEIFCHA